ncbi:hypothetical protein OIU91_06215 [Streptomyces sp. NBC_01456]|uniref:hypothetical protein n=1 Tax=Streptomyces sp. NBC_01456 TaxID=2975868 RepID=UPI002E2F71B0|nr:hypothetical protein [Streptomyces sp. NBC_01456]
MEIVNMKHDGTIVVELSAQEAKDVRDDLGAIPHTLVTGSGDQLHSLLEWAQPSRRTVASRLREGEPSTEPALSCERCRGEDANRHIKNGGLVTGCPACGLDPAGACAACRHTHDAGGVCGTLIATGGMYARRCQCTGSAAAEIGDTR